VRGRSERKEREGVGREREEGVRGGRERFGKGRKVKGKREGEGRKVGGRKGREVQRTVWV